MVIFAVLYLQPQCHPYRVCINCAVFLHKCNLYNLQIVWLFCSFFPVSNFGEIGVYGRLGDMTLGRQTFGRKSFFEMTIWATRVGRLGDRRRDVWATKMKRTVPLFRHLFPDRLNNDFYWVSWSWYWIVMSWSWYKCLGHITDNTATQLLTTSAQFSIQIIMKNSLRYCIPDFRRLMLWTRASSYRCWVLISVVPDPPFNQTFNWPFTNDAE